MCMCVCLCVFVCVCVDEVHHAENVLRTRQRENEVRERETE